MSIMGTMLPQNEPYEVENRSCDKYCLQELTNKTSDHHKSAQERSFPHQSTEEILMESHCNELELELAALTMLFKSLRKDGAFDSKGVPICGNETGCDSFEIVTNLDENDCALLEVHLEELRRQRVNFSRKNRHTIVSRVNSGPQQDLIRKSVEQSVLFQDKLTNKKQRRE